MAAERRGIIGFFIFLALGALGGCGGREEIAHYSVPKQVAAARAPRATPQAGVPGRMLAAIVPSTTQAWFFKLTGPPDLVAAQQEAFGQFLQSLAFPQADVPPTWTLPPEWTQKLGSAFRFATIEIGSHVPPLELTVTMLPKPPEGDQQYALANINRWRGQLTLPPISLEQLSQEAEQQQIAGVAAWVVDLTGSIASGGMERGGMLSGQGRPPAAVERPAPRGEKPRFTAPEGWQELPATEFRQGAFHVVDGARQAEITLIGLPGVSGGVLANVNRWRQQIQLAETTDEELKKELRPIDVGEHKGLLVDLAGPEGGSPREAIVGAIVEVGSTTWFVKLKGDAELAAREKERFEAFVKGIRFSAPEGKGNGD